jgi:glycosyltransferase involved in cell wall biosynthesis
MFSVIIPTYNNINYLKLCIKSLKQNSKYNHELIFHINEGTDGTLDFLNNTEYKFSYSSNNKGVCVAFNEAVKISTKKYIVLGHDDMYFCPEWDEIFNQELKKYDDDKDFFLSGTMVQPFESYIYLDCGKTINDFNEQKLLSNLPKISYNDFQGTHWQPSLIPRSTWDKVGGFSEEFSPGLGSDPDFNMKLWKKGVRLFKGLGKCRVYHFSSISLRKKAWNNGSKIFLLKWGISIKFFKKYFLKTGENFDGELNNPAINLYFILGFLKCKINFILFKTLNSFSKIIWKN